jgi:hypothetical protein
MSIYRLADRYLRRDVHAPDIEDRRLALVPSSKVSQIKPEHIGDYRHLRMTTPTKRVFPRTLRWVEMLPSEVRPIALLRRYPRIANLVASVWGAPKCLNTYMESLLTDQRGDRRGFPPDVLQDLVSLRRYYDNNAVRPSQANTGEPHPFHSKGSQQTKRAQTLEPDTGAEAYKRLRKNQPANIPLPRTKAWFENLPPSARPSALMRQFPRIANFIAAAWDDLVQFEIYVDSLLNDKRGGRKGFPSDVIAELGTLDTYRHTVQECAPPAIAWSDVGRRG